MPVAVTYNGRYMEEAAEIEKNAGLSTGKTGAAVISGAQVRAARALLGWTARALAVKASVPIFTIEWIEGEGKITGSDRKALAAVQETLEADGVDIIGSMGVQLPPAEAAKGLPRRQKCASAAAGRETRERTFVSVQRHSRRQPFLSPNSTRLRRKLAGAEWAPFLNWVRFVIPMQECRRPGALVFT